MVTILSVFLCVVRQLLLVREEVNRMTTKSYLELTLLKSKLI
jgi:hypothetical protein